MAISNKIFNTDILRKGASIPITSDNMIDTTATTATTEPPKKKRGRPKKSEQQQSTEENMDTNIVSTNDTTGMAFCQTNDPYENTYMETNNMLKTSIFQIDVLTNDVKGEIENIKHSKTIKGKYKYMADLCSTASSLVSTKLSAIKEINSTITNCHKLEMQRVKDLKANAVQQDDDKYIADLYNAYINTPTTNMPAFMANTSANMTNNIGNLMQGMSINTGTMSEEEGFNNFLQNMTPEQNRMILGDDPNIETVVVVNPNTGEKSFDVINTSTGIPVQNYPRPSDTYLDDTILDMNSGIATNTNLKQNWKIVILSDQIENY